MNLVVPNNRRAQKDLMLKKCMLAILIPKVCQLHVVGNQRGSQSKGRRAGSISTSQHTQGFTQNINLGGKSKPRQNVGGLGACSPS